MATRTNGWLVGLTLVGSALSANAMADGGLLGSIIRLGSTSGPAWAGPPSTRPNLMTTAIFFTTIDGQPLGWNAVIGVRPIPFLGAEAEYIDFGNKRLNARSALSGGRQHGSNSWAVKPTTVRRRYLPSAICRCRFPGWSPSRSSAGRRSGNTTTIQASTAILVNGVPVGQATAPQNTHPSGAAYGGGVQFHFSQLAVRAQYERISGSDPLADGTILHCCQWD